MERLYPYIGPQHLAKLAEVESTRWHVDSINKLAVWLAEHSDSLSRNVTVTFVVLSDGLWVADRRSEHIACARGKPVLSAGEMSFAFSPRQPVELVEVSNQSTGYCPEPESWLAVAAALDKLEIRRPEDFTVKYTFRRCPSCAATNIVKNESFDCALCGSHLPLEWNFTALET